MKEFVSEILMDFSPTLNLRGKRFNCIKRGLSTLKKKKKKDRMKEGNGKTGQKRTTLVPLQYPTHTKLLKVSKKKKNQGIKDKHK